MAESKTHEFYHMGYEAESILQQRVGAGDNSLRPVLAFVETVLTMINRGLNLDEALEDLERFRRDERT